MTSKRKVWISIGAAITVVLAVVVFLAIWLNSNDPSTPSADGHAHTLTHVEAEAATCQKDGRTEHWLCAGCGKYFGDANASTEIDAATTVIAGGEHVLVLSAQKQASLMRVPMG